MNINLSLSDIAAIVGAVITTVGPMIWGLLKALQKAQESSLQAKFAGLSAAVKAVADENRTQNEMVLSLERKFMAHQVELAKDYVRRDDFIRTVASIQASVDNAAMRMERAVTSMGGKVQ